MDLNARDGIQVNKVVDGLREHTTDVRILGAEGAQGKIFVRRKDKTEREERRKTSILITPVGKIVGKFLQIAYHGSHVR